jgi:hypothetical protein
MAAKSLAWQTAKSAMVVGTGLALVSTTAEAIDLTGTELIYQETFAGEVGFPTRPEVDLLGLGSIVPTALDPPVLNGTAAHFGLAVDFSNPIAGTGTTLTAGDLASGDVFVVAGFDALNSVGSAYYLIGQRVTFTDGSATITITVLVDGNNSQVILQQYDAQGLYNMADSGLTPLPDPPVYSSRSVSP